jgi:ribosomal protein L7/L12
MAPEAGEFTLIVASVDSNSVGEAARQFAKAFSLDEAVSTAVCKGAPIIFAQKLTRHEVKAITPLLTELSKAGMEFRVTARVAQKLPKLNWPVRPTFTASGCGDAAGLAFDWDNSGFVCPGCGESFLFRRLGKLKLVEPPAEPDSNGAAPKPAPKAVPRPGVSQAPTQPIGFADEGPRPTPRAIGVEGLSAIPGEGESLDLPEALEEAPAEPAFAPEPAPEPVAAAVAEPELLPEPVAAEPAAGEFSTGLEEAQAAPLEPEPVAAAEPALEEAPMEEAPSAESGELYNVFLSKITDPSKRDKASELIAKVKGCSAQEAKELTTRLVIPLAKNVAKGKAEDILNQFKKLKIFGRMTKVK